MTITFIELSLNEQIEVNGGVNYFNAIAGLATIGIGAFECYTGNLVGGAVTIYCGVITFCTEMGW